MMLKITFILLALCLSLSFSGCSSVSTQGNSVASKRPRAGALTRETAISRSKNLGHINYILWFALDEDHPDFEGRAVINFVLKRPKSSSDRARRLPLDLEGATLSSLIINGNALPPEAIRSKYDGHHIHLETSELHIGNNRIEVAYSLPYSRDGNGLHRFKDPEDGEVYLYSNFEPYSAHRVFPCFDQPDLKASFELTVEAPENWQVISSTLERDVSKVDGRRSWAFPPSPLLSPYVFAIHAGPYRSWKADASGIPLRLFARKTMAQHVDPAEWFTVVEKGIDFFSTEFGYPYPYSKYDQLLVPELSGSAEESAAAVTLNEDSFIFRTKSDNDRHRNRAQVILHELSHMWFGNLVTMRWWNGLWLKESFATYMSAVAVDRMLPQYQDQWRAFQFGKAHAYYEDLLITSHPVEASVPDTDSALTNFDSLTYAKGAAALKQLSFFIGEDEFRDGIQRHFQRYALRNTTIHDFIEALSEASDMDLSKAQRTWLQTSGVNTVQADWSCGLLSDSNGKKRKRNSFPVITKFVLLQTVPELRNHRSRIALAYRAGDRITVKEKIDAIYGGPETAIKGALGKPCPVFVFPNDEDFDYVRVALDPVSRKVAETETSALQDAFLRQLVWTSLWEMVLDGNLAPGAFAEAALKQLPHEKDAKIVSFVLAKVSSSDPAASTACKFMEPKNYSEIEAKLETLVRRKLTNAAAGSDLQKKLFDAFADLASSTASLDWARSLLKGGAKLGGLPIDQDRRWNLIMALARNGAPDAPEKITQEEEKDATHSGFEWAIAAKVQLPDPASKQKWLDKILTPPATAAPETNPEALTLAALKVAMRHFHTRNSSAASRASVDAFFKELATVPQDPKPEELGYFTALAREMYPSLCEQELITSTTEILKSSDSLPAGVVKALLIHRQEEERCVKLRAGARMD